MRKTDKKYSLTYLDNYIKNLGLTKNCFQYMLDDSKMSLCIIYLDFNLREQYILVFRTSRLRYCVWHNGFINRPQLRTCRDCGNYLKNLLAELNLESKFNDTLTVKELSTLNLDTNKRIELHRRTSKK